MRLFGMVVALSMMLLLPAALHADEAGNIEEVDHLAMYRGYIGEWDSVTKNVVHTEDEPVEFETKEKFVQRSILSGAMIEIKGVGEMDGEPYPYLWLYGYSGEEDSHVGWFHDEQGIHAKFYGSWSEKNSKMTWTLAETDDQEVFVTIVDDLSEPDRLSFSFKTEDANGRVLFSQTGHATRAKE